MEGLNKKGLGLTDVGNSMPITGGKEEVQRD